MRLRCAVAICVLALSVGAWAGEWISPAWPDAKAPRFEPVPLHWLTVSRTPVIYRKVVDVPGEVDRATVLLRTADYAYVCVDGRQVFAWAALKRTLENPGTPADPARVHELDLTEFLTPGPHVLTVSAPANRATAGDAPDGAFVIDGGLYAGTRRVASLATDATWTATMFRPTTIVEDQPIMTPGHDGQAVEGVCSAAAPVRAGQKFSADEDALAKAYYKALVARIKRDLDEINWRYELLAGKGIYIVGDTAYGWVGRERIDAGPALLATLADAPRDRADARLKELAKLQVASAAQLAESMDDLARLKKSVKGLSDSIDAAGQAAFAADQAKALELALKVVPVAQAESLRPDELRKAIEAALDHPLNYLNESRYDRLGWLPISALADSRIAGWSVRINPATGPTRLRGPETWRFRTDPDNTGEAERIWSAGYDLESQMDRIKVPGDWSKMESYADYKGPAWYRARIVVPDEWAGSPVVLSFRVGGTERVWVNDVEVTEEASGSARRQYTLGPELVRFGAENVVSIRVDADGDRRGLVSSVWLGCPSLAATAARNTPPVDVLATPLSPCVVLTPSTDEMEIHHAGTGTLVLPGKTGAAETYLAERDGKLAANWAMLWLEEVSKTDSIRPILLVFASNPVSIACEKGVTRVKLAAPRQRVIAVRPWGQMTLLGKYVDVRAKAEFWSRAALAVPINYLSVTRVLTGGEPLDGISVDHLPAGPVLGQTVVYDYLVTKDQWGTKPLKLAPLPALCSLGVDSEYPGLTLDQADRVEEFQFAGLAGPYRGVRDADRVSYSYPIEPWPRLMGFTSWLFGPTDAGVPGNRREMELLAATGANGYRAQHNWSDELPPEWLRQGDKTRVEIIADACNLAGLTYVNNIDETLGDDASVLREHYDQWVQTRLLPHYDKLAAQLKGRAFDQVAYDLVNEPHDHQAAAYNATMKELTRRIRRIDKTHLLYIEPPRSWGAVEQMRLIEPTGDPLTMYSFHDYSFRLLAPTDRWPTMERDFTSISRAWWPAVEFAIRHGAALSCGEFGGFAGATNDSPAQRVLLNDFFRLFDQFGMHANYYSGRDAFEWTGEVKTAIDPGRRADGACRATNVAKAYRAYFARGDFNRYYARR